MSVWPPLQFIHRDYLILSIQSQLVSSDQEYPSIWYPRPLGPSGQGADANELGLGHFDGEILERVIYLYDL